VALHRRGARLVALRALAVASRPADEEHAYGHTKAEYFSSGFEGALVLVAAVLIAVTAIDRLIAPRPLDRVGTGLAFALVASVVNLVVARLLLRAAAEYGSIALEADAHHLMTDVWTSAGVLAGVGLVGVTGWNVLDPLVALLVAANITRVGVSLVRRSMLGLLDTALPAEIQNSIREVLDRYTREGFESHALRTRQSGRRSCPCTCSFRATGRYRRATTSWSGSRPISGTPFPGSPCSPIWSPSKIP
jgi:cation diffusion facilitator family transporter